MPKTLSRGGNARPEVPSPSSRPATCRTRARSAAAATGPVSTRRRASSTVSALSPGTKTSRAGPSTPRVLRHGRCVSTRASSSSVSSANATTASQASKKKKKVVVVGGGWAGFGAAYHLAGQDYDVTLLDAAKNVGGLSQGYRRDGKYAMEAGMKGFWYQYPNIFNLVKDLGIENPFTDWTESNFYTPEGLLTEGPVFQNQPRLPSMLGQAAYTFPLFNTGPASPLSPVDLASMLTLLPAMLSFNADPETYEQYDEMSAKELFRRSGVTRALYENFLKPLLLVGLFAPPEELSAASVLETLYFYAAAHQFDFDMCWCRGTVREKLFDPLCDQIAQRGGKILGGRAVTDVLRSPSDGRVTAVIARELETGELVEFDADEVVFAVGINALQKITRSSRGLSELEEFRKVLNLSSIDCVCARIWLKTRVECDKPANVLGNFEENCGATFFHLNDLHDEFMLPGVGSVFQADYYNANAIVPLTDEEIVEKTLGNMRAATKDQAMVMENVEHYEVIRAVNAVTHFKVGAHKHRPEQRTSVENLFIAGDWIKGLRHGSNGLSQERSWVTGVVAANAICERDGKPQAKVYDVEEDEAHLALGKWVAKQTKGAGIPNLVQVFNQY